MMQVLMPKIDAFITLACNPLEYPTIALNVKWDTM